MKVVVGIPFRDRGRDPLRQANLDRVLDYWLSGDYPIVCVRDDGRQGDEPFNRSAAYNNIVSDYPDADVYVFTEADMILPYNQIELAVKAALAGPGLVVGFDRYCYMGPQDSEQIRRGRPPETFMPEYQRTDSIGAVNVVSHQSLSMIGGQYDETFQGNGYDDDAMLIAFAICCGPTRVITGPGYHLYHDPAWPAYKGDTLTEADIEATNNNRRRLHWYSRASRPEQIRVLTQGGTIWRT
jgi:hypothetical protein